MYCSTISVAVDPAARLALASLRRWLVDEGTFNPRQVDAIVDHVREHGAIDDKTPFLFPFDIAAAEEAFASGFEPVSLEDPSWGSPEGQESRHNPADDVWNVIGILRTFGPIGFDGDVDPRFDDRRLCPCGRTVETEPCKCEPALPPMSGGSLDDIPPPYEPTPEDWAAYEAWSRTVDYLDNFNAVRNDGSETTA